MRAIYDWIVDNSLTPHLLVQVEGEEEVEVPMEYVKDGRIVLSLAPAAVRGLELGQEYISFGTRFSGRHVDILVPVRCVLAIYARENGRGIALADEDEGMEDGAEPPTSPDDGDDGTPPRPRGRPRLRIVN